MLVIYAFIKYSIVRFNMKLFILVILYAIGSVLLTVIVSGALIYFLNKYWDIDHQEHKRVLKGVK